MSGEVDVTPALIAARTVIETLPLTARPPNVSYWNSCWRHLGVYVSRILDGVKPTELPIIQPTKFELIVNLKTAMGPGLRMADSFLRLADEVIE
jgi:hypothetical protein